MEILKGKPVSPGLAVGQVYLYSPFVAEIPESYCQPDEREHQAGRLDAALAAAGVELDEIVLSLSAGGQDKAKIFAAQREILRDEEIIELAQAGVLGEGRTAEFALQEAFGEFIVLIGEVKDAVIASRVADFKDVRDRVLRILLGAELKDLSALTGPVVVVAQDLAPSDTAMLDRANVLGIITEAGGFASHTAIIAGSYGIPAVLGVAGCMARLADGGQVGLDALAGDVFIQPDEDTRKKLAAKQAAWQVQRVQEGEYLAKPARMSDGTALEIGINIGTTEKCEAYTHSDFVGLLRTEFLYMEGSCAPTEDEQLTAYRRVLGHAAGKPVTLRTLDIGGDKTLPYMSLPKEANPFLGRRALRLCLQEREMFRTQLRAALRASQYGELWVMVPMVGSIDDICAARAAYDEVREDLAAEGVALGKKTKFGIMIEVPSIALVADMAAREVDFASIGTNDLCQYLCAVERTNPALDRYYQSYSPAMVRMLGAVSRAFAEAGKPLSVCGEMAGEPRGAVLLAGLGLRKLSMSPGKIAGAKAALARVSAAQAGEVAMKAQTAATQREVLALLDGLLG